VFRFLFVSWQGRLPSRPPQITFGNRGKTMYVELHTSSAFSFLDGASLPEVLVEQAKALGYDTLALLDRDGVYGAPRFYQAARKAGLRALVGADARAIARAVDLAPARARRVGTGIPVAVPPDHADEAGRGQGTRRPDGA
jgi:hypothetical protein